MITLAKMKQLTDNISQSPTLNLLNKYLNLSTEFRILNLIGLPIYFFNPIRVKLSQFDDIIDHDDNVDELKQKLYDLVADVDKMYKQILDVVNKF